MIYRSNDKNPMHDQLLQNFNKSESCQQQLDESANGVTEKLNPLTCALEMAPHIKNLLGEEIGFYVSDLNTYTYCSPGKVKLALVAGDAVKEGSTAFQTMRNASRTVVRIGKEVYGLPYLGIGYPLTNPENGTVIGSIVTTTPIERQENLASISKRIEEQVNAISMATSNLSTTSEELAATTETLGGNARGIREEIKKTDGIVALIQEIAEQTHMLGLNAAIEAARVGDAGRGFNVVAGEIRKLSQDTQRSVKDILQTLKDMQQAIIELTQSIEQMAAATQQQAASAQEISASVNELGAVAAELKQQADELIK